MTISAEKAAEKTSSRGCRMAIKAATRKVLSPISEKMIMVKERMKEWKGCITPPASSSGRFEAGVCGFVMVSRGSLLESESGLGCGISCGLSGRPVGFYGIVSNAILFSITAPHTSRPTAPSARVLVSVPKTSPWICFWSLCGS